MAKSRDNKNDPTPYAVICHGDSVATQKSCGLVFLQLGGEHQYSHQLNSSNRGWYCPNCGSTATWDDYCQETDPQE